MKITWLGHAAFKLECDACNIVFDPYKDEYVPGLSNIRESADIVLMSHTQHDDHNGIETICLSDRYTISSDNSGITVIDNSSGKQAHDISISKIDTFHDHHNGTRRGPNTIYIVEVDGFRIAHMGDIGFVPEAELDDSFKMLLDLDLLILPVGGFYTIDAEEAVEYMQLLKPRMVIPMHFSSADPVYGYDEITTVDDFTSKLQKSGPGQSYIIEKALSSAVELEKNTSFKATILTPKLVH